MVQKMIIDWRNCYGIKELHHEFLFKPGKQDTVSKSVSELR